VSTRQIATGVAGVVLLGVLLVGCRSAPVSQASDAPTVDRDNRVFENSFPTDVDLDGDGLGEVVEVRVHGDGSQAAFVSLSSGGTYDIGILHPMQNGSMVRLTCGADRLTINEFVSADGRVMLRLTDLVEVAGTITQRWQPSFDVTSMSLPADLVDGSCK